MLMHVITNFTAQAGAETMLARLVRESRGSLVVPLMDVGARYRAAAGDGVRFHPLKVRSSAAMALAVPRLARLIRAEKPDVVLCWMYHAMAVGALAHRLSGSRAPLFWNVRQSLDDLSVMSRSMRAALHLCRALSAQPSGILFNSARAAVLHRDFGFRNPSMTVVPNGFEPVEAAAPPPREPRVFGIAARLHPQKDHRTFFRAAGLLAQRFPDARFVAAGHDLSAGNATVRGLLAESGLSPDAVTFCGEVDDMAGFYRSIDVLVLSSLTEGFPNVVAEAMSHGRPVVTTDVGDAAAIVGETGIVVPPGDAPSLAAGMERMLRLSAEDYVGRCLAARHRIAEHYSLASVVGRFRSVLGEV